jgi:TonB family protein
LPDEVVTEKAVTSVVNAVAPEYPTEMLRSGQTGYVTADVKIDMDGRVTTIAIRNCENRAFAKSAETALKRWTFNPIEDSPSVGERTATIPIRFDLPDKQATPPKDDPFGSAVSATLEEQVITAVPPIYPASMRHNGKSGSVLLGTTVNREGKVIGVVVLDADDRLFADAAKEALWQWQFAESDGNFAGDRRYVEVPIRFVLAGS